MTQADLEDDIPKGWVKNYIVEQKNPKAKGTEGYYEGRIGDCYEYPDGSYIVCFPDSKPMYLVNRVKKEIYRCWPHI